MNVRKFFVGIFLFFLMAASLFSIPLKMNYQGIIRENGVAVTGDRFVRFRIYDALTGGNLIKEISTAKYSLENGILRATIDLSDLSKDSWNNDLYLEVSIGATSSSLETLSPREQILPSVFAINTKYLGGKTSDYFLIDAQGSVDSTNLNVVSIDQSTGKIIEISTSTFKSVDGSSLTNLNADELKTGTVDVNRLPDIPASKITGALTASQLGEGSIGSYQIEDSTITTIDIKDGTIVNADISSDAGIAGTKISPDFGSQNIITTGNITAGKITASTGTIGDMTVSNSISLNSSGITIDNGKVTNLNADLLDGKDYTAFVSTSGSAMSGILDMGGNKITNLGFPTSDTDAATKQYVDSQTGGGGAAILFATQTFTGQNTFNNLVTISSDVVISNDVNIGGSLILGIPLSDAYVSNSITIDASGSVADNALSSNVSLLGQTIESNEITDGEIVDADISGSANISASKINDGSGSGLDADLLDGKDSSYYLDPTKISTGTLPNYVIASSVAVNAIESNQIKDGSISSDDLGTDSVGADEIATGAVGSDELASSGVSQGTYGDGSNVPQITVDVDGRITGVSNVKINSSTPTLATVVNEGNIANNYIVINSTQGGLRIVEDQNGGVGTLYGKFYIPNLTADRKYTFPDASGTVWTSGNDGTGSTLDADFLDGYNTGVSGNNIIPYTDGSGLLSRAILPSADTSNKGVVIIASDKESTDGEVVNSTDSRLWVNNPGGSCPTYGAPDHSSVNDPPPVNDIWILGR